MIEVIDQYGAHYRFDDNHFFERFDDRVEVATERDSEVYTVATFPHPSAYGEVGAFDQLSLRDAPPGIIRRNAALEDALRVAREALRTCSETERYLDAEHTCCGGQQRFSRSLVAEAISRIQEVVGK